MYIFEMKRLCTTIVWTLWVPLASKCLTQCCLSRTRWLRVSVRTHWVKAQLSSCRCHCSPPVAAPSPPTPWILKKKKGGLFGLEGVLLVWKFKLNSTYARSSYRAPTGSACPVENPCYKTHKVHGFTAHNSDLFTHTEDETKVTCLSYFVGCKVVKLVFLHARVLLDIDIKRRQMKSNSVFVQKLSTELQFLLKHLLQNTVC